MKVKELEALFEGVAKAFEEESDERLFTGKEVADVLRRGTATMMLVGGLLGVFDG